MYYPDELIEEVRAKSDIVDVISMNLTANQTLYAQWQTAAAVRTNKKESHTVTVPAYYELALYSTNST